MSAQRVSAMLLTALIVGCGDEPAKPASASERAVARAREWVDALEVDAVELTKHGVKGKKKLGEILATYLDLYRHTDADDRGIILERVRGLAAQTERDAYHNLRTCPSKEFNENSMSYLRVLRILELLGADTTRYRRELELVKPRLDAHFANRGAWQKAVFANYYDLFGLERPPILEGAQDVEGIIARRVPIEQFNVNVGYMLTHEVFAAFDYGNHTTQDRFDAGDLEYLRLVLPKGAAGLRQNGQADLLAEFLTSIGYLGWQDDPEFERGIRWLLDNQNADGTWGDYSSDPSPWVAQKLYLHTVHVAIQALLVAERSKS